MTKKQNEPKGRIKRVRIEYEVVRDPEGHDALFVYYSANGRQWAEAYRETLGGDELVICGQWYEDFDGEFASLAAWHDAMLGN